MAHRWLALLLILTLLAAPARAASAAPDPFAPPDGDGDGLADVLEAAGWYSLGGGPFFTSPTDADSDDDSLSDGEEKLFGTHPLDAHSPGLAGRYDPALHTGQYFSIDDPQYLAWRAGGEQHLMTGALVARRGQTVALAGPGAATLTITAADLPALSPVRDPARGGWTVTIPSDAAVGEYTAAVSDGGWSYSLPFYVIFELPAGLDAAAIDAFLYDGDPANLRDETSVFFTGSEQAYYGDHAASPQACPLSDVGAPCSLWPYHTTQGYARAFWNEQFTRKVFVDHALQAIHGQTEPQAAAAALGRWIDREFRLNYARTPTSWTAAMQRWSEAGGATSLGGSDESAAGVLTAVLRAAGIPARPFAVDLTQVAGHAERPAGQNGFETAALLWVDGAWQAMRPFAYQEGLFYPWASGSSGLSPLGDWDTYTGEYGDDAGDLIISAAPGWDFQSGGGMVDPVWPAAGPLAADRDYEWDSRAPLQIVQSPQVELLACQVWQGDAWAPGEWRTPPESSPAGRSAAQTYVLPAGLPAAADPLENWPYNPQPTACSPSTGAAACAAFQAAWTAVCPAAPARAAQTAANHHLLLPVLALAPPAQPPVTLGSILADAGYDRDGDGRFDELRVSVQVSAARSAAYRFGGVLRLGAGVLQALPAQAMLQPGVQTVVIAFDGRAIGDAGSAGPYTVTALWAAGQGTTGLETIHPERLAAYAAYSYSTHSYAAPQFRSRPAAFAEGVSLTALDANHNGALDTLRFSLPLDIAQAGTYRVEADLYDGQGRFAGHAQWSGSEALAVLDFDITHTRPPYRLAHAVLLRSGELADAHYTPLFEVADPGGVVEGAAVTLAPAGGDLPAVVASEDGVVTFSGVDADDDGRFDRLAAQVNVRLAGSSGDYRIEGALVDETGAPLAWAVSPPQRLEPGAGTLTLEFDGGQIFDRLPTANTGRSLRLAAIKIFRGELSRATLEADIPGGADTPDYTRSQFAPSSPAAALFADDLEAGDALWAWSPGVWQRTGQAWKSAAHAWMAAPDGASGGALELRDALDLSDYAAPVLRFQHSYRMAAPAGNGALEVSLDGVTWTPAAVFSGATPHWATQQVDLSAYGEQPSVRLRFNLRSQNAPAWFIDDVALHAWPAVKAADFSIAPSPAATRASTFTADYTSIDKSLAVVYRWDFGDGSAPLETSNPSVEHTFAGAGSVQVTLTVRSAYDQAVVSRQVTVGAAPTFALTISAGAGGSVTRQPDQASYAYGQVVTLTAVPNTGSRFSGWGGDLSGATNPATITMNADRAVTAGFANICYPLTLSKTGQGSLPSANPAASPGCSPGEYIYGQVVTLTGAPDPGWHVAGWDGTDADTSSASSNTVSMPPAAHSASVTYASDTMTLPQNLIVSPGVLREDFETTDGWTVSGSAPGYALQLDTVNVRQGAAGVRLTAPPGSGYVEIARDVVWDLSSADERGNLRLWIYAHNSSEPTGGSLMLAGDTANTNYFVTDYGAGLRLRFRPGWNLINVRPEDWRVGRGAPAWNAIRRITLRLNTTEAAGYTLDELVTGVRALPAALVTFDDGERTLYTEAFAYMKSRYVRGTGYVVVDWVGGSRYATWTQLREMEAAGWTIGSHTYFHPHLSAMSPAGQQAELLAARQELLAHGLVNVDHVAYPFGDYNADTLTAMSALGMRSGRSLLWFNTVSPLAHPYEIPQRSLNRDITLEDAKSWVDTAILRREILVLTLHDLTSTPRDYDWYLDRFRAFIDYCVEQGIPLLTMEDLYRLQSGPVTIPTPR